MQEVPKTQSLYFTHSNSPGLTVLAVDKRKISYPIHVPSLGNVFAWDILYFCILQIHNPHTQILSGSFASLQLSFIVMSSTPVIFSKSTTNHTHCSS